MSNTKLDSRFNEEGDSLKQKLVNVLIEHIEIDLLTGDFTVLDELLNLLPTKNLVAALPDSFQDLLPLIEPEIVEGDLVRLVNRFPENTWMDDDEVDQADLEEGGVYTVSEVDDDAIKVVEAMSDIWVDIKCFEKIHP